MSNTNKIYAIVLGVLTVVLIVIDVFEVVTKGTVVPWYLLATAACLCACVANVYLFTKKK